MIFSLFILPALVSFFIGGILTPLTIRLAKKLGLVDNPRLRPHPAHIHERILPRAGGIPIYFSLLITSLFFLKLNKHLIGIFLGAFILLITGLIDDRVKVFSPFIRILLQILAAAVVVASGVGISFVSNPFGGVIYLNRIIIPFYLFGPHRLIPVADIFAFFWIVWMMNIINWSKGVDGQMPGIISVAALTIAIVSLKLFFSGDPNQLSISQLAAITAGAAASFLLFNWYPSKILPGFSGSTILGFMIATLSILSGAKLATAFLVILLPAVDFVYTFFRRIISHQSPFLGDRGHLHHKLLSLGWSHQKISLFYILSCAILGLLATILSGGGKVFTLFGVGMVSFGALIWLNLYLSMSQQSGK